MGPTKRKWVRLSANGSDKARLGPTNRESVVEPTMRELVVGPTKRE